MSVFLIKGDGWKILINGLLETELNSGCPKHIRDQLKPNRVRLAEVTRWRSVFAEALGEVQKLVEERVDEGVASLHDVKTATSLVYRNAEALIQKYPGDTFHEKADSAPSELTSLLKSVSLLNSRFMFSSLVTNPESAKMGKQRPFPVYKVFDKMRKLFSEIALRRNIHIELRGSSFKRILAYDSLETVALVLIDNAVKYSDAGRAINVTIRDEEDGVYVSVESKGPVVPDAERDKIFQKGFRATSAKDQVRDGSGLGLYIGQVVAEAHDTKIWYKATDVQSDGCGTNVFSIKIKQSNA